MFLKRRKTRWVGRITLGVLLLFAASLPADDGPPYLTPVETLDNGVVSLQVALKVGRIVSFHRANEKEWVAVEDKAVPAGWNFNPWGGDRIWPTGQMLCYQIYKNNGFDPIIDGKPWQLISRTKDSLVMKSGFSPQLGLQITRKIQLIEGSAEVLHSFVVERSAESIFPVHVWGVTGVRKGDSFFMESDRRVQHAGWKPFKWWQDVSKVIPAAALIEKSRFLKVPAEEKLKIGTYGRWVAMVDGSSVFLQSVAYDPDAFYIETSNLQVFANSETSTYEIETLSPSWPLRPGEHREWQIRWKLADFPKEAVSDLEKAEFLNSLAR